MKQLKPKCPKCQQANFEVRFMKDDGIASAKCAKCGSDYLLLDSGDYWFDVIQKGYPRCSRCSCKNTVFELQINYNYRNDGEIDYIEVWTTCSSCNKTKRQMSVEIDYGGTEHLFDQPLVFCKNPKILYDLKDLSFFANESDLARIVEHLHSIERCRFVCCVRAKDRWEVKEMAGSAVQELLGEQRRTGLGTSPYFYIYAMPKKLKVPRGDLDLKAEDVFWKRHELIRVRSPSYVDGGNGAWSSMSSSPIPGCDILSFHINFSTEFVKKDEPSSKSKAFAELCARFLKWLQQEFVSWRGPQSFDNPEVHVRIFGDHFQKKARKKS